MDTLQNTPTLVLLDCQKIHFHEAGEHAVDHADTVRHIERVLTTARYCGWSVVHSQLRPQPGLSPGSRSTGSIPIDGLRPRASEAVFTRSQLSAFSDPMFEQTLTRGNQGPVFMVGFSLAFSVLATIYEASARHLHLTLVEEAIGCAPLGHQSPAAVRSFLFSLINQLAGTVGWSEVHQAWVKPGSFVSTSKWGIHHEHFRQQDN
jgi:nicotinamidase-related amidase